MFNSFILPLMLIQYDWNVYKDLIYQHYLIEDRTLEEVRDILAQDFSFKAGSVELSKLNLS